ncbi:MAG TPA: sigma-54-dependent Fis family transcriptional regulator [Chlorobaculum sp.]|uniref:Sigma-54-dependent transcriptional regulator n=1 Tax=Chlorobaculum tepidum (strain ATCC 49652 / DSM 12025 / NBRC 103806 / TLS) TaxID=194439 RepID=Q8KCC5_CHLTE|nr:sigma-54 dependent transcriptional regulator [Chlorobaculum tepidum]AAM72724.1 sigma-54-dependent transcriptional regulator [Chlorobaculum tepidum TLS]HBU22613.1 sigma-54-dependent Fis family transcriptional regulator [Chlorobaculum sp.]
MSRSIEFIGRSAGIVQLRELAMQVADTDVTVLITGETGSGKEVLARFIHDHSRRAGKSMIPVNCGAIPSGILESELFGHEKGAFTGAVQARKGYFESADKGTIFLDEIGEMPLETQVKFLRVIETGQFQRVGASETISADTRIIAATNRNLNQAVAEKHFREDLYYRLKSVELLIPPLRERGSDILMLAEHFVHEFERKHAIAFEGFSQESGELMLRYPWPGNVRELRNLIEALLILERGKKITPDILEKHLVQRSRHKGLVHEPGKSEKNELHLIYSSLIQLRQEIDEIRQMLQQALLYRQPTSPLLLPALPAPPAAQDSTLPSGGNEAPVPLKELEKRAIGEALTKFDGNKRKTALALGINERTLYRKIKEYGL